MKRLKWIGLITLLLTTYIFAIGVSVGPAGKLIYVRLLGEPTTDSVGITIKNVNNIPMAYKISVVPRDGAFRGYTPIPDTNWVRPATDSLALQPHDSTQIPLTVTIPNNPAYYNRAWLCEVSIMQLPLGMPGGIQLVMGARATWFCETASNLELSEPIEEPLAVAPSVRTITYSTDPEMKGKGELSLFIRNDSEETHTYTFETYFPEYGDTMPMGQHLDILPLAVGPKGWILDKSWVYPKPDKFLGLFPAQPKITLAPGEVGEQLINVELPDYEELGGFGYEAVILIKTDDQKTASRFARVVIVPEGTYLLPPEREE